MRQFLSACGVALSAAFASAAESPESLVQKLGSPRYAEREAAGQELLSIGSAALPAVKVAAETSSNPEIRERAAALLEPLSRSSDSSKLLSVPKIKIEYKALPLSSAVADFKAKTGIPLVLVPGKVADANRPITVPAGEYAPWEALEVLLKAAGLREDNRVELPGAIKVGSQNNQYYNRRILMEEDSNNMMIYTPTTAPVLLVDGVSEGLPSSRSGGVRVTALPPGFAANRVVRGAGRVIFHLDAAPLPSTGWHGANGVRISIAEDEDGRPVFADLKLPYDALGYNPYDPWNQFGGGFGRRAVFWGGGGMAWIDDSGGGNGQSPYSNPRLVPVAIRTNDRAVKKLRRFEGVVLGEVHTPNVPIVTIENLEKCIGANHSTGQQQSVLTVQEVKKQENGTYTVKIRHESLTQWALQQMRGRIWNGGFNNDNPGEILNRIKFYDAAGKLLAAPTQEATNFNGDGFRQSIDATLRFPKNVVPARLVVTGTKITSVEVPFKMVNVAVP